MKEVPAWTKGAGVCPWWFVRSFDNPLRRLAQNPTKLLAPLVRPGDSCLDIGSGIGYFTIPMARLVGSAGAVTALDVQPRMLEGVRRRAEEAGVSDRVTLCLTDAAGFRLEGAFDFALMFWMAHEVPDRPALFGQVRAALRPGGRLLLVEPKGHVGKAAFERTVGVAEQSGLVRLRPVPVRLSRAVLMGNPLETTVQ